MLVAGSAGGAGRIDAQGFRPAPSMGSGYLQTLSGRLLPAGLWDVGLMANYGAGPLVLRDTSGREVARLVEHLATLDLTAAVGIVDFLELGLDIPLVLHQGGEVFAPAGPQASGASGTGIGDIRLVPRVRLTPRRTDSGLALSLALDLGLPTGDDDALRGGGLRVEPRLAGEYRFVGGVGLAVNVGYAFQDEARLLYVDMEHLLTWSVGVDVPFSLGAEMAVHLLAEVDGAVSVLADELGAEEAPVEALLGGRFTAGPFAVHLAAGAGIVRGVGSPEWRVLLGLSLSTGAERDGDGDGIVDRLDLCPAAAEDPDLYADDDGCPDLDNDGDGVADLLDACPSVPVAPDADQEGDGCPDPAPGAPSEPLTRRTVFRQEVDRVIYFPSGSEGISGATDETLLRLARFLIDHPEIEHVWVEGHADDQGREDANMDLSRRRAEAIRSCLVDAGVDPERLTAVAFGETQPIVSGGTPARRSQNRRVELRFAPLSDTAPAGPPTDAVP